MFDHTDCEIKGCPKPALIGKAHCFEHLPDRAAFFKELSVFIASNDTFSDLSLPFLELENKDLRNKSFILCNFSHSRFRSVRMNGASFRMCFFDSASFQDCRAEEIEVHNSVFAASSFEKCNFEGSTFLQVNFNNLKTCADVNFNGSDLYNSRFIGSRLERISFVDCNLKNVDFRRSIRKDVSFKYSNQEDAIFDEEGTR